MAEGSVGAGTGTRCFNWKGGIGTSSRVAGGRAGGYTVGVLVQTNFGGHLTMGGMPVGPRSGQRSRGRSRGRLLHDRGGDGRSLTARDFEAAGGARGFRIGAHRVAHIAMAAAISPSRSPRRPSARIRQTGAQPATYEALGTDAVSPLFDMALEIDRGGGLQLAAAGHHGAIEIRYRAGDSDRSPAAIASAQVKELLGRQQRG